MKGINGLPDFGFHTESWGAFANGGDALDFEYSQLNGGTTFAGGKVAQDINLLNPVGGGSSEYQPQISTLVPPTSHFPSSEAQPVLASASAASNFDENSCWTDFLPQPLTPVQNFPVPLVEEKVVENVTEAKEVEKIVDKNATSTVSSTSAATNYSILDLDSVPASVPIPSEQPKPPAPKKQAKRKKAPSNNLTPKPNITPRLQTPAAESPPKIVAEIPTQKPQAQIITGPQFYCQLPGPNGPVTIPVHIVNGEPVIQAELRTIQTQNGPVTVAITPNISASMVNRPQVMLQTPQAQNSGIQNSGIQNPPQTPGIPKNSVPKSNFGGENEVKMKKLVVQNNDVEKIVQSQQKLPEIKPEKPKRPPKKKKNTAAASATQMPTMPAINCISTGLIIPNQHQLPAFSSTTNFNMTNVRKNQSNDDFSNLF